MSSDRRQRKRQENASTWAVLSHQPMFWVGVGALAIIIVIVANPLLRRGQEVDEEPDVLEGGKVTTPADARNDDLETPIDAANRLMLQGKGAEAIAKYLTILEKEPENAALHYTVGGFFVQRQDYRSAIRHFSEVVRLRPDYLTGRIDLGSALLKDDETEQAIEHYRAALKIDADSAKAHNLLGVALLRKEEVNEAIPHLRRALALDQEYVAAHKHLALALEQKERFGEAISHYRVAANLRTDDYEIYNNLAWLLATCPDDHLRDGSEAVRLAERACELTRGRVVNCIGTLAAAYAEAGDFSEAVATAERARQAAADEGLSGLELDLAERASLYKSRRPSRLEVKKNRGDGNTSSSAASD